MTTNHYIILIVAALFIYWVVISLIDMLESKKSPREKKLEGNLMKFQKGLK